MLEILSGHSEITMQAAACGWQARQPFQLAWGEDAFDPDVRNASITCIEKEKPDLVALTSPCSWWSLQNLTAELNLLALKRKLHRPLWAFTWDCWDLQNKG